MEEVTLAAFIHQIVKNPFGVVWGVFSILTAMSLVVIFWRANKNPKSPVNLTDLFLDHNGKVGGSQMRLNMAFMFTSWALVYVTLQGQLTEWLVGAYLAAFVADRISSRSTTAAPTKESDNVSNESSTVVDKG
jgi:amino acid permease